MYELGARDAIAYLVLVWIPAVAKGSKVAIYCSDVSGAFDRVEEERLLHKLKTKQIDSAILEVLVSWLRIRSAKVLVGSRGV